MIFRIVIRKKAIIRRYCKRRGMRLRVHGFLQSRDYRESLEEFISKARKSKNCSDLAVAVGHNYTEAARQARIQLSDRVSSLVER